MTYCVKPTGLCEDLLSDDYFLQLARGLFSNQLLIGQGRAVLPDSYGVKKDGNLQRSNVIRFLANFKR